MVRNRTVQIRLTKQQYERIVLNTEAQGFPSLSAYMRFKALEQDYRLYEKVSDIHAFLLGEQRSKKEATELTPF